MPDGVALILGDGAARSSDWLRDRSRRLAALLAARGVRAGDTVAILMDNRADFLVAAWAAQRSGLYYAPVNRHLTADEAGYILRDCGAVALLTSAAVAELAGAASAHAPDLATRLMSGGPAAGCEDTAGFEDMDDALAGIPAEPHAPEREGAIMFYSSGTTGRPKGIRRPLSDLPFGQGMVIAGLLSGHFGFDAETVYLCPGPLYHAAPLAWSMGTQRLGGCVALMDRFDPEATLALIERHRVTHAQFVPTMFVRMLALPERARARYDTSSLRFVVHAAAPCPEWVKRAVIDWFGPIVHEYYAASEGNGFVAIDSPTWLRRPGSVGRPLLGTPHITDDEGRELPPGEVGTIWFGDGPDFSYHNDPERTAAAHDARGWSTLGDVGHLDSDGFLYLSDRRTDLIISGGVNVYPHEVEDVLLAHPAVADVAVIGVPDKEMGQRVTAVVQPVEPGPADRAGTAAELLAFCRERLAGFKCPRAIEFDQRLPRTPTGKLVRRTVRDRWSRAVS